MQKLFGIPQLEAIHLLVNVITTAAKAVTVTATQGGAARLTIDKGQVSSGGLNIGSNVGLILAGSIAGDVNVNPLIGQDGSTLISQDGGGVVSNDGGTVVSNDGGTVVSHDGGSIVSHDGGSAVAIALAVGVSSKSASSANEPKSKRMRGMVRS